MIGALVFGRLSGKLGRRRLFMWTLAIYLAGMALTALTPKGSGWIIYLYATRDHRGHRHRRCGLGHRRDDARALPGPHRCLDQRHLLARAIIGTFASSSIRAEALVAFFAIAQIFGAIGPTFYGFLIGNGSNRSGLTIGYIVGGGIIMIIGGLVEIAFGINAEGKIPGGSERSEG